MVSTESTGQRVVMSHSVQSVGMKRVVSYCVTGHNAMLPSGPSGID